MIPQLLSTFALLNVSTSIALAAVSCPAWVPFAWAGDLFLEAAEATR